MKKTSNSNSNINYNMNQPDEKKDEIQNKKIKSSVSFISHN
jgi:hypothetical protein